MTLKLDALRGIKKDYDEADDETRAVLDKGRERALIFILRDLPALNQADQAAVAWYVAELFASLGMVPAGEISDAINHSSVAYGLATIKLLGWDRKDL